MDQFEKLKTIRLTKANQQKLLDENNGFIAQTNYNSITILQITQARKNSLRRPGLLQMKRSIVFY